MSEANVQKTVTLTVKNIQRTVPDAQKPPPPPAKPKIMTTASSSKRVSKDSHSTTPKRAKNTKLSLPRKSKKVEPDGKKQLSMDNYVIKSPRASPSSSSTSNDESTSDKAVNVIPDTTVQVDVTTLDREAQSNTDNLVTTDQKQEEAQAGCSKLPTEKKKSKSKKGIDASKKSKKSKKPGDSNISKKKTEDLDSISVNLNVEERAVNEVELAGNEVEMQPSQELPSTPKRSIIQEFKNFAKHLRTPVKASTPMMEYASKEEQGMDAFPDPVDDPEFETDCDVLREAFEKGVVDGVDISIAKRMFYRYKSFLEAVENEKVFSMRHEEYCKVFKAGKHMDFAPGCIVFSDDNIQLFLNLIGENFSKDSDERLNKMHYFMLVLLPEMINKIVMAVYKVNKKEAIKMKKNIAIKVTEELGELAFW